MADEHLDRLELTSVRDHQAIYRPSSNALQLDTSLTSPWSLRPFDISVATEVIDPNLLNIDNGQTLTDTPSAPIQIDESSTSLRFDDVGSATGICDTRPSTYATEEDWTRNQSLIKQIYLDQKKTLPDLMRVMESKHNFRATKKMYKSRITKWGLDKKNKENEMRAIVRKRKSRTDQGKHSIIRVRGRALSFTEVARYWHRKGVSIDDVVARRLSSETPEAVEITTPIPSPVLPPQQLAIPEYILRSIQNYIASFFEDGTWVGRDFDRYCSSIQTTSSDYFGIYLGFTKACVFFLCGLFEQGGRVLHIAAAKLDRIVLAGDPYALFMLCSTISSMCWSRRSDIALTILRQVSALSEVMLAGEHPLHHICASLLSVASSQFEDFIHGCLRSMDDQIGSNLGVSDAKLWHSPHSMTTEYSDDLIANYRRVRPKPLSVRATEFGLHEKQRPVVRNQPRIGTSQNVTTEIEDMENRRSAAISEECELIAKLDDYMYFMGEPDCDCETRGVFRSSITVTLPGGEMEGV